MNGLPSSLHRETHDTSPKLGRTGGLSKAQPWALDHEQSGNLRLRQKAQLWGMESFLDDLRQAKLQMQQDLDPGEAGS